VITGKEGRNHNFIHSFNRARKERLLLFIYLFCMKMLRQQKGKVCLELSQMYHTIYKAFLPLELTQGALQTCAHSRALSLSSLW